MSRVYNEKGSVQLIMVIMAMLSLIVMHLVALSDMGLKLSRDKRSSTFRDLSARSGIETFLTALKFAEASYLIGVRGCPEARGFFQALRVGHGCSAAGELKVFDSSDLFGLSGPNLHYSGPWMIEAESISRPDGLKILEFDQGTLHVQVRFVASFSFRNQADFMIVFEDSSISLTWRESFSALTSDVGSQVLSRGSDAKIVITSPLQNDSCQNQPSMPYLRFNGSTCAELGEIGGGSGLASYRGSLFAFRPWSGDFVYLPGNSVAEFVEETGKTTSGKTVFPPFRRESLVNFDDVEVNAEETGDDEIVGITGYGPTSVLAVIDPSDFSRINICKVGKIGGGVWMTGLSRLRGNMPLLKSGSTTVASFVMKSNIGQLYLLGIRASADAPTGIEEEYVTHVSSLNRYFVCTMIPYESEIDSNIWKTADGMTSLDDQNPSYVIQ